MHITGGGAIIPAVLILKLKRGARISGEEAGTGSLISMNSIKTGFRGWICGDWGKKVSRSVKNKQDRSKLDINLSA